MLPLMIALLLSLIHNFMSLSLLGVGQGVIGFSHPVGTILAASLNNTYSELTGKTISTSGTVGFNTSNKPNSNWTATLRLSSNAANVFVTNALLSGSSQDFCVEFLIKHDSTNNELIMGQTNSFSTACPFRINAPRRISSVMYNSGMWGNNALTSFSVQNDPTTTSHDTNWHHMAYAKSGTTCKLFYDGVEVDTATVPATLASSATGWRLGFFGYNTLNNFVYLGNYRIVEGSSVYTSNFTPRYDPFPI